MAKVGSTVYTEADEVATTPPAVTDTYGRDAVWVDIKLIVKRKDSTSWDMGMVVMDIPISSSAGTCTLQGFLAGGGKIQDSNHKFVEVIVRDIPEVNDLHLLYREGNSKRRCYKLEPQTTEADPYFHQLLTTGIVDVPYSTLVDFIVGVADA